ncbi:hypothetical protein FD754_019845 [Muntiacus muntjak]|uniref:Uncharacterized protein n=1 Tax=Muntiacus muntjak TaxID=9888 RepID=A0A5N3V1M9_MUNMU|nr:hypothetical protein FD754_019845 [Muntiacus muntjak]
MKLKSLNKCTHTQFFKTEMEFYKCIHQSLEDNNRCPKCNYVVDNIDHLYPNFLEYQNSKSLSLVLLCILVSVLGQKQWREELMENGKGGKSWA